MLDGPNAALGHNSAIYMIETQVRYVLSALDRLLRAPHPRPPLGLLEPEDPA